MSVPAIVQSALGDAEVVERVSLGGEDELFVTSESTIIYRSDGLLSDESVDEYPHEATRLSVTEGRRKTKLTLEYAIEGTEEFKIPGSVTDAVVHPVLAGVLAGNGITDPGERVIQTFRFSELTVIVTSQRLVKHIGSAVWDEDFEEYRYEDVTGLSFESGSVATQVVLEVDGRQQRIKAPNEQATELRQRLQQAIFAVHDVDSLDELHEKVGLEDDEADTSTVDFGEGVDPLSTDSSDENTETEPEIDTTAAMAEIDASGSQSAHESTGTESSASAADTSPTEEFEVDTNQPTPAQTETAVDSGSPTDGGNESVASFEASGFEPATAGDDAAVLERLDALEETVERQTAMLERQQETIEQLIEELRRGR
ncbi:hypothetical protein Halru_2108 [Halovivax ruber XH-70]|uniref:DUF7115 domain-containing protein n=1 Tax=Halovivax ruber (strain DSM 18193 / JCM 13892 / XH-70) TaxID=797302 RepID=L0ID55_HALRX|nr:hypothetical protein [Halovivax ruber]AGB16699.1 hypothetical protein Halru_2108 [Halovivax ruber XH-70]